MSYVGIRQIALRRLTVNPFSPTRTVRTRAWNNCGIGKRKVEFSGFVAGPAARQEIIVLDPEIDFSAQSGGKIFQRFDGRWSLKIDAAGDFSRIAQQKKATPAQIALA